MELSVRGLAPAPGSAVAPKDVGVDAAAIGSPTVGRITSTIADNPSMPFALGLDW